MNKILHAPPSSPSAGASPFALPSLTCRRRKEGTEEEEEDKNSNDEDGGGGIKENGREGKNQYETKNEQTKICHSEFFDASF